MVRAGDSDIEALYCSERSGEMGDHKDAVFEVEDEEPDLSAGTEADGVVVFEDTGGYLALNG